MAVVGLLTTASMSLIRAGGVGHLLQRGLHVLPCRKPLQAALIPVFCQSG